MLTMVVFHSWLTNTDYTDIRFNPSWNAGLLFIYHAKKNFGVGIDVKYSAEGNKFLYRPASIPEVYPPQITQWNNFNYIRVPVKLMYFFGKKKNRVQPELYAGPDFGLVNARRIVQKNSGQKFR